MSQIHRDTLPRQKADVDIPTSCRSLGDDCGNPPIGDDCGHSSRCCSSIWVFPRARPRTTGRDARTTLRVPGRNTHHATEAQRPSDIAFASYQGNYRLWHGRLAEEGCSDGMTTCICAKEDSAKGQTQDRSSKCSECGAVRKGQHSIENWDHTI